LQALRPSSSNQSQGTVKIDHMLGSAQRVSGTLFYRTNINNQPFDGDVNIPDYSYNALLSLARAGIVRFTGTFTNNALGDFLLGQAATFRQTSGTRREFRRWDWESFIQDDWKLSHRIILNLGIRYCVPQHPLWASQPAMGFIDI
jgi:outer membrane receptor for ferrienterochelin and colicin